MNTILYADANAGLPATARHLDQVCKRLLAADGNPSSVHVFGRKARIALEESRRYICSYLKITPDQFIFTSGGTESNNLVMRARLTAGKTPHIIYTAGDHPSVRATATHLSEQGLCRIDKIPLDRDGIVQRDKLAQLLCDDTVLVCLTHANSETGVINDVVALARLVQDLQPQAHVHCDAVQTLGKLDLQGFFNDTAIDSAAFSAHKLGALKGCGGLYVKDSHALSAQLSGGSQEQQRRAGTENLSGIISFGLVIAALEERLPRWQQHVQQLKNILCAELANIPNLVLHGSQAHCLPNTASFHIDGVRGEDLVLGLDLAGFAVSSGSACSSGISRSSRVLKAMGYEDDVAGNAVRVSFTTQGDRHDIVRMAEVICGVVKNSTPRQRRQASAALNP